MNPLLLSQKNHYKAFFLKYCKLQLRAIYYFPWLAFCSGQRIQAKSGQKINSTALFACHLWKIYLDDDHAKARKEADHCWDTTVFAALANVKKKKIIIFFTFEMSKFILGSILQKMNERRGKMDANFAWVISRFQPPFNIALPLILI